MILVSFGLWFIVVFGIRIAVWGNPLYRMVVETDSAFLAGVDALITGQRKDGTEEEFAFLNKLTRLTLLQLAMLFLELVLLAHLWWVRILPVLTFSLFIKDLLAISLGIWAAHRERHQGMFAVMLCIPRWVIRTERLSAVVSAVGALVLFLAVNNMSIW